MASAQQLLHSVDNLLQPDKFKDYGPNGLQVEGKGEVAHLISGVTASQALIERAIDARADAILGRGTSCVGGDGRRIGRIAWCTVGAQGFFESAIAAGADAYVAGEISEPQAHYARECGVAFVACGHHASERFGAPAVAAHVAMLLGIEHQFIDIDNPA